MYLNVYARGVEWPNIYNNFTVNQGYIMDFNQLTFNELAES